MDEYPDDPMADEPFAPHWSESYTEPVDEDKSAIAGEIASLDRELAVKRAAIDAKVTPMHKNQCPLCGHYPLLPPWNEGERVKCPMCGARIKLSGHA